VDVADEEGRALDGLMDQYPVIHSAIPESDGSGVEVETTAKGKRSLPNAAQLADQVGISVRVVVGEPPYRPEHREDEDPLLGVTRERVPRCG